MKLTVTSALLLTLLLTLLSIACSIAIPARFLWLATGQIQDVAWARGGFEETGRPPSRVSGGSRGNCLEQVIALVPGQGQVGAQTTLPLTLPSTECTGQSEAFLARSLTDSPTFWFYVPAEAIAPMPTTGATSIAAQFTLLDENQQPIAIQSISLPKTAGIIGVTLAQPLTVARSYRWVFSVLRNPRRPSQNPTVEGMVQWRGAEPALAAQLQQATGLSDRLAIYAKHEVWHDALTELAQARRHNLNEATLKTTWVNFLIAQGLGAIAEAPILECCSQ